VVPGGVHGWVDSWGLLILEVVLLVDCCIYSTYIIRYLPDVHTEPEDGAYEETDEGRVVSEWGGRERTGTKEAQCLPMFMATHG
jgi:hypothetical protein